MIDLKQLSIKQKMLLMMVSTSLLVLVLASMAWIAYDYSSLRKNHEKNLKATASIIGSNISAALSFKMADDAAITLKALQETQQIIEAVVYDADGKVFVSYNRDGSKIKDVDLKESEESLQFLSDSVVLHKKISFQNEFIGTIYIRSDLSEIESHLNFGIEMSLLILMAAIIISLLVSLRLQTYITGPLNQLVGIMRQVSKEKTFELRASKLANDETGVLVDGFNLMLEQLQLRENELARYREQLEEKVRSRTSELEIAIKALQESENKMRAIFDTAADGIITFDEQARIVSFNRAAAEIFGYQGEELIGLELDSLTSDKVASTSGLMLGQHLIARAKQAPIVAREFEGLSKAGKTFPMELSVTHVVFGEKQLYTAILRDITIRKAAEEQLIQAKVAAENLARTKSQFLANMSHEIRTPMNGIFGALQIVLKSPLNDEQRDFLEMMQGSADSLLRIVNDVLDFSKADAGKLNLEAINFQLRDTIERTLQMLKVKANEKSVAFSIDIDNEIPDSLVGDPHRLGQILVNLTANALKFTEENGFVAVRVSLKNKTGGKVVALFSVKDSGIGIAADKQKVIFEAFTQADTSSTRQYGGTGLGLAIVSNLVRLMGGEIWVNSEIGVGSEFSFTITFEQQRASSDTSVRSIKDEEIKSKIVEKGGIKVLLAEDHPVNQKLQKYFLENLGFNVTLANNGCEAVELCKNLTFDLIMMDCQMPEMDGFDATRLIRIQQKVDNKHVPIIAMTAHALAGDKERCLQAGMDDYISKPIQQDVLKQVIEQVLNTIPKR